MEISGNALNAGLNALQAGQRRVDQAAADIAGSSLPRPEQAPDSSQPPANDVELTTSLTELKVGKTEAQAAAKVIETADEVLGTLVDIRA